MNKHHFLGLFFSISLSLTLILQSHRPALAQSEEQSSFKNHGAIYYLGDRNELLMRVNIWGFVLRPGQYMVPKDTDLISLISFAGGPREEAKVKKIKVIRQKNQEKSVLSDLPEQTFAMNGGSQDFAQDPAGSIHRNQAKAVDLVYEVNVKKYLATGDQALIPELKPGDTIIVEGSTFHFITKALEFTAKLAVFVNIYYLIQIANNR